MSPAIRQALVVGAFATLCALTVSLAVAMSNRTPIVVTVPASTITTNGGIEAGIVTSGDATVSRRPDIAFLSVSVEAQASTAAQAQRDLATQAGRLIAKAKSLGIPDAEINTSNYSIYPMYAQDQRSVIGFRASEQLALKWHHVDTTGTALDALVQQGGATGVTISFGLSDPKAAMAEARSLAIADARSRAAAMAKAAGVNLGQVLRVADYSVSARTPSADYAAAGQAPTQVPVGQLDVTVSVEAVFAIA
jgi:uncharacterized protein